MVLVLLLLILKEVIVYVYVCCVCTMWKTGENVCHSIHVEMYVYICMPHRTALWTWLSPTFLWVLRIKLRSPTLDSRYLCHLTICLLLSQPLFSLIFLFRPLSILQGLSLHTHTENDTYTQKHTNIQTHHIYTLHNSASQNLFMPLSNNFWEPLYEGRDLVSLAPQLFTST